MCIIVIMTKTSSISCILLINGLIKKKVIRPSFNLLSQKICGSRNYICNCYRDFYDIGFIVVVRTCGVEAYGKVYPVNSPFAGTLKGFAV